MAKRGKEAKEKAGNVNRALRGRQVLRFIEHLSRTAPSDDKIAAAHAVDPDLAFAKYLAWPGDGDDKQAAGDAGEEAFPASWALRWTFKSWIGGAYRAWREAAINDNEFTPPKTASPAPRKKKGKQAATAAATSKENDQPPPTPDLLPAMPDPVVMAPLRRTPVDERAGFSFPTVSLSLRGREGVDHTVGDKAKGSGKDDPAEQDRVDQDRVEREQMEQDRAEEDRVEEWEQTEEDRVEEQEQAEEEQAEQDQAEEERAEQRQAEKHGEEHVRKTGDKDLDEGVDEDLGNRPLPLTRGNLLLNEQASSSARERKKRAGRVERGDPKVNREWYQWYAAQHNARRAGERGG